MATAKPELQTEKFGSYDDYELLTTVSEKCFHAAKKLDSQKKVIRRVRIGATVAGGIGVVASIVTVGDFSAFEMISGSAASQRMEAATVRRNVGNELKCLADEYNRQLREIVCEESSDDSAASSMHSDYQSPVEKHKGTPLFLGMKRLEHFRVHSKRGGKFQMRHSDIILDIPPDAISVEVGHIQAAVCTDFDCIRRTFHLDDDEEIVSPLVEYKFMEPSHLLKPVAIHLPHLLLKKSDTINVYHVSMNEDGTFDKQTITDYIMNSYQEDSNEVQETPYITIETRTFSCFFVCRLCRSPEKRFPELLAAVKGQFIRKRTGESQRFTVQLQIWDKRLILKDFRTDEGIPPNIGKIRRLELLTFIQGTKLHVEVKKQRGEQMALCDTGGALIERKKVFDLPHELKCKKCLKKGKSPPMQIEWLLHTTSKDSVAVSVEVQHRGCEEESTDNSILCIIEQEGPIPQEVIEKLQRMGPQQHSRAAQEIDISTLQFEHVLRYLIRGGPSADDHGAEAAEPQPSASAYREYSVASTLPSLRQRQSEMIPVGIRETRQVGQRDDPPSQVRDIGQVGQRDDPPSQVPPAADIPLRQSSETTCTATQLYNLK